MLGRLLRRRRPDDQAAPPAAPALPAPGQGFPVLPRAGRPASLTEDQLEALEEARFLPPAPLSRLRDLSTEEAATILAALAYARAAIRQITGEDAPTEIENEVLGALLGDEAVAAACDRWVSGGKPLPLRENAPFAAVRGVIGKYWAPPAPPPG